MWLLNFFRTVWEWLTEFWRWLTQARVQAVSQLTATYIGGDNGMEKFKIAWTPSPSLNVDKHELYIGLDGATPGKAFDMIASATSQDVNVTTGATVTVFVRTYGDNSTTADSAHLVFEAIDETPVLPVGGLTSTWISHTP